MNDRLLRRKLALWVHKSVGCIACGGAARRVLLDISPLKVDHEVRIAQGREAVDVLLKEMKSFEDRLSGSDALDFSDLRSELGLGLEQRIP